MKVDLAGVREHVAYSRDMPGETVLALLAVVDAAREAVRTADIWPLRAALEPFTPPPDRAWEEVDRWNAQQKAERDLAVKAAVDATPKPTHFRWAMLPEQDCEPPSSEDRREWTRDYVALVGEVVQRQFRSDQERIAELETERDEWRGRHKAVTNGLSNHVARADQAEEQLARVPALVEALRMAECRVTPVGGAVHDILTKALAEWEKP